MSQEFYRLKESVALNNINENLSILITEQSSTLIQTEAGVKLLKLLEESPKTKEEIVLAFMSDNDFENILLVLHEFVSSGFVLRSQNEPYKNYIFWEELGYNPDKLATILHTKSIGVKVLGEIDTQAFRKVCNDAEIIISDNPDLLVVFTNDYLNPHLEHINSEALRNKIPWLLIRQNGINPYIGPLFNPGKDNEPCWLCLKSRMMLHSQENKLFQALKNTSGIVKRPVFQHVLSVNQVANHAVLEVVHFLYYGEHSVLEHYLFELNIKLGEQKRHYVTKRQQCCACGNSDLLRQFPEPVTLNSGSFAISFSGGYRSCNPEATLAKYQHHVSPVTGIVPFLKPLGLKTGAPVYNYSSGKNLALSSNSLFWLNQHLRSANGGKGSTEIQARVGALCESVERYCLIYQGNTYTKRAAYSHLENAIHPNHCMLFSKAQYECREQINRETNKFYSLIPVPFDINKEIEWTPVYSLTNKEFKFLPTCYCYAQYPSENEKDQYSYPDSNGCAAGNTIEEAILQGFLELVERDAAAIWWYNRIQRPALNLESTHNEYIFRMQEYYREINRSLYVLDITTDLGIPVFAAISHSLKNNGHIIYAFGAHIDANIAVERAIVELNQLLPVFGPNNTYITKDQVFINWLNSATIENNIYLKPLDNQKRDLVYDFPSLCKPTIYDSLQFCIETAKVNGIETLVLDLTQPDIGLPVVKVIAPGLRHFWRRTAPGRLYDVPGKMRWLSKANKEEELNPLSIFI